MTSEARVDPAQRLFAGNKGLPASDVSELTPPREIYFIRHGETRWSLSGQHTGRTEMPLNAHGKDQARELGELLRSISFSEVRTSPRKRARETLELAGLVSSAKVDEALSEWDYGDYEGLTTAQIRTQRQDWNVYRDGCPGGETPDQISDRADRVIAALANGGAKIALFSHAQFGCVLAARWIGLPVIEAQHFSLGPASLNILGYKPGSPELRIIARMNGSP